MIDRQGRVTSRFFEDYYWERNTVSNIMLRAGTAATPVKAVPVESSANFRAGVPQKLFEGSYAAPNTGRGLYDVSRDGQRFLMIKGEDADSMPKNLTVVLNWDQELKRLVPTR